MKEFGAVNTGVDVLKRWLLTADNESISYLMKRNVVDADDMKKAAVGELIKLTPGDVLKKLLKGYKKTGVLIQLNAVLNKAHKAKKTALSIPAKYNEARILKWQNKIDTLMRNI